MYQIDIFVYIINDHNKDNYFILIYYTSTLKIKTDNNLYITIKISFS